MKTLLLIAVLFPVAAGSFAAGYFEGVNASAEDHRATLSRKQDEYIEKTTKLVEWMSCHWLEKLSDQQLENELQRRRSG